MPTKSSSPPGLDHLYVITRLDVPQPHRSVQIAHAAMAAVNTFGFTPGKPHPNLVICAVATETELIEAFNRLKELGVPCCGWHEDDMHEQLTAVATAPLFGDVRRPLKRFKLLTS